MIIFLILYYSIYLIGRELLSQLLRNWWFHFLIICFTSFTGILITRQYQYTKRINFLQRMLVITSLSLSHVVHSLTLYTVIAQMTKRQEEVERIQECNCILLTNLMPEYVVNHFLNPDVNFKALVSSYGKIETCMYTL